MTVDHYNESWLEHILTQKLSKELGNERESSGKIEKEFILYKNNWLLNNKMNRDWFPHSSWGERTETEGKVMGKKFLPPGSCQSSGIMQSPKKYNIYFLQISNSLLLNSIESQCSATDVYSMPLLIISVSY